MNPSKLKKAFTLRPAFSETLILLFLFGLALFCRFHKISEFPVGLKDEWSDNFIAMAHIYWNQPIPEEIRGGTYYAIFPLRSLLTLLAFHLFGVNQIAFSTFPLLISALGAPISYLCFREIFSKGVGFLTGFFLAVSYWDVSVVINSGAPAFLDAPLMTAFCWMLYRFAVNRAPSFSLRAAGVLFALMLFQGNWYFAGCAFLIGLIFFWVSKIQPVKKDILPAIGWSLGSYILLLIFACHFLKVSNPVSLPIANFRFYFMERAVEDNRRSSLGNNLKKIVRDVFAEAERDTYHPGWPIEGHPWLDRSLSLFLGAAFLMGALSFGRSLGTQLLLTWILIPPAIFAVFFTVYAHHSTMVIPPVLAGCAMGLTSMAHKVRRWVGGAVGRVLAISFCGVIAFSVAVDGYRIYFKEFPSLRDRGFPNQTLAGDLVQRGIGRGTLIVSDIPDIYAELELWVHVKAALSKPALDFRKMKVSFKEMAQWPLGWEGLAFEKGWKRIIYIFSAVLWKDKKDFTSRLLRSGYFEGEKVHTIFFGDEEYRYWKRRNFPSEEVYGIDFRNGDPAFYMTEVMPHEAKRGRLAPKEHRAISSMIPKYP